MPRKDAHRYAVVGCELMRTEVAVLETLAREQGVTRSELVKGLVRDFLARKSGLGQSNPIPKVQYYGDPNNPPRIPWRRDEEEEE